MQKASGIALLIAITATGANVLSTGRIGVYTLIVLIANIIIWNIICWAIYGVVLIIKRMTNRKQ